MNSITKMVQKDAARWARAEMFFGEGAGTRRKLLWAEIGDKMAKIPGYEDAFGIAYDRQDMASHAIRAAKERKRLDRSKFLGKNARALARGDRRNVSPVILVAIGAAVVLHQTGYDKVLIEKAKTTWSRKKREVLGSSEFQKYAASKRKKETA